jgi:alcohol dehydrogenase class IV
MWYFLSPKIAFGEDSIEELAQLQGKKAFLVTDAVIHQLGYPDLVRQQLDEAGISMAIFDAVEPDPSLATVRECAAAITAYEPDWVIGLGGGSCLDAAKAAWFLYERPDIELDAINPFETFGLRNKAHFATIPTTSGTGADVSWGFALHDPVNQSKLVRVSRELIPDLAIIDPVFVMGLPKTVTADAGMDVLAHAVEAYTNLWHNDFTDAFAIKAIELVFRYLRAAVTDGSDVEAREHMHNAASLAGLAFSNTAIIIAHSLAHAVGARFHTHHGRTVGMFLPYTIEYNAKATPERFNEIAQYLNLTFVDSATSIQSLVMLIRDLAREIDQPLSLAELGIPWEEFEIALPGLTENALNSVELLANPRQTTPDELDSLFRYAYYGKSIDF